MCLHNVYKKMLKGCVHTLSTRKLDCVVKSYSMDNDTAFEKDSKSVALVGEECCAARCGS